MHSTANLGLCVLVVSCSHYSCRILEGHSCKEHRAAQYRDACGAHDWSRQASAGDMYITEYVAFCPESVKVHKDQELYRRWLTRIPC